MGTEYILLSKKKDTGVIKNLCIYEMSSKFSMDLDTIRQEDGDYVSSLDLLIDLTSEDLLDLAAEAFKAASYNIEGGEDKAMEIFLSKAKY